jgi:UDP-N-acetylmuramoyl-tripeptide--D-alanyl-D-alanine ligase
VKPLQHANVTVKQRDCVTRTSPESPIPNPALRLTAGWVVEAMGEAGARLTAGASDREFSGVSIDTRTVARGELFVAIRGERFDGAEFAAAAVEKGAAGIVVPRGRFTTPPWSGTGQPWAPVMIEVEDTTRALQALARTIRRKSGAKVIAITGSAGKTTTKEVAAELLALRYRAIRNRGNLNNHIGLPLSLIELRQRPEVAVVELGMNHAGEISTLVRIAEPDVRVWTNVGDAHLGFFSSVDAIADAKAEILEGATSSTVLVANADDDRIAARLRRAPFAGRVVTFGIDRDADVRASEVVDRGIDGTVAQVTASVGPPSTASVGSSSTASFGPPSTASVGPSTAPDSTAKKAAETSVQMTVPLIGRANLSNVLAATAIASWFGVPLTAIADRVAKVSPAAHRGEIVRLPSGVTIVDDSYNANPSAMKQALGIVARTEATRRVAVLGEMLELGDHARRLHEDVGRAAARSRIDLLFVVGGDAAGALAEAAVAAGLPREAVRYFRTIENAVASIVATVGRGDLVLVKGSRGVKTDRVVERLKAERG